VRPPRKIISQDRHLERALNEMFDDLYSKQSSVETTLKKQSSSIDLLNTKYSEIGGMIPPTPEPPLPPGPPIDRLIHFTSPWKMKHPTLKVYVNTVGGTVSRVIPAGRVGLVMGYYLNPIGAGVGIAIKKGVIYSGYYFEWLNLIDPAVTRSPAYTNGMYLAAGEVVVIDGNRSRTLIKEFDFDPGIEHVFFNVATALSYVVPANKTLTITFLYSEYGGSSILQVKETASQVIGTDGANYTCISAHTSAAATRPITGGTWSTVWEKDGSLGVTWVSGEGYTDGGGWADIWDTSVGWDIRNGALQFTAGEEIRGSAADVITAVGILADRDL